MGEILSLFLYSKKCKTYYLVFQVNKHGFLK